MLVVFIPKYANLLTEGELTNANGRHFFFKVFVSHSHGQFFKRALHSHWDPSGRINNPLFRLFVRHFQRFSIGGSLIVCVCVGGGHVLLSPALRGCIVA